MSIYIYGCGGHARSICGVLKRKNSFVDIRLVDKRAGKNEVIMGITTLNELPQGETFNFYGIGDNSLRREMYEKDNSNLIKIISPYACQEIDSYIGRGTFVGNFANIGAECYINDNCIINTGVVIEHECFIGMHTHIAPKACICGRSKVGNNVFIGAGAVVSNNITICSNVIVGAGSVVIKDIAEAGTYVGSPVRRVK